MLPAPGWRQVQLLEICSLRCHHQLREMGRAFSGSFLARILWLACLAPTHSGTHQWVLWPSPACPTPTLALVSTSGSWGLVQLGSSWIQPKHMPSDAAAMFSPVQWLSHSPVVMQPSRGVPLLHLLGLLPVPDFAPNSGYSTQPDIVCLGPCVQMLQPGVV